MEGTNKKSTPSSLPANYVTITELKERWLKEKERQQKEEEERLQKENEQQEEELRQQKLREEKAKQPKPNAVVRKPDTDSRPRNRGNRRHFRLANRNVSESEGTAELEGKKSQEPEEKTGRTKNWKKKKNVRAEKEATEKEGTVDPPQASSEKGRDQAARNEERNGPEIEIRAKSKNAAPVVRKFRNLSVNGENERGGDWLSRRPGRVDHLGGGEIRVHRLVGRLDEQRQRGFGRVWVKKGEVVDGNGGGVQSLDCKNGVPGQTGTSLTVSSLKLAGQASKKMQFRRSERNAN